MSTLKKRHIIAMISAVLLLIAVFFSYQSYQYTQKRDPPKIAVGIRSKDISSETISFTWTVQNRSSDIITFDADHIAQIELNGQKIRYPTEARTLGPDEEVSLDITLTGIRTDRSNRLKISADTNEGTTATIKETISPSS